MTQSYPIIDRRYLDPAQARGLFGLGRRNRSQDGLPKPHAHEVMVYRVDGQYVLDNGSRSLDDDAVVRATHVSLIDVSRDVPVVATLVLPSAEASEFTVHVTFVCSVVDPIRVARENVHAETVMTNYLKQRRKIFELGLPYGMMQVNDARRDVSAQITAYTTVVPPVVPGMAVRMTSVEVRTPAELIPFERERLQTRMTRILATDKEEFTHERDTVKAGWDRQFDVDREDHAHQRDTVKAGWERRFDIDRDDHAHLRDTTQAGRRRESEVERQQHDMETGALTQRYRHELERRQSRFAREELEAAYDSIQGDPDRATLYAHVNGQIDSKALAEHVEAKHARTDGLEREDRKQFRAEEREDHQREWSAEREERVQIRAADREHFEWQRDQEQRREREAREDKLLTEQNKREDDRRKLDLKFDILRTVAARGGLDMVNFGLDKIIADVYDIEPEPREAVDSAKPKPVSGSTRVLDADVTASQDETSPRDDDDFDDPEPREEDSD